MKQLLRISVFILCLFSATTSRAVLTGTISSASPLSGCDSICSVFSLSVSGCSGTYTTMWFYTNHATSRTDSSTLPVYCFNQLGVYDVSARVTCSASGETITITNANYVNVHHSPIINFTTSNPAADTVLTCGPRNICFINTSNSDTAGCAFNWTWIVTGPDGVHYFRTSSICYTFSTPGNYSVSLQYFAAACGCFGSVSKPNFIKIQTPATACFARADSNAICGAPASVAFTAACTSGATSYVWHFGDHTTATTTTPSVSHTFTASGYYSDTLYARTSVGCLTRVYLDSDVFVGNFTAAMAVTPDTICSRTTATFTDTSHVGGHAMTTSYFLLHGTTRVDSMIATNPAAFTFSYPAADSAGAFRIMLDATDSIGCHSIAYRNIYVRASPLIASVTADTLYKCTPSLRERFHSLVFPSNISYRWAFGDTGILTGTGSSFGSPTHTYVRDSVYSVSLKVTDRFGCSDSVNRSAYIKVGPPTVTTTLSVDSGCVSASNPLRVGFQVDILPAFTPFAVDSVAFGDSTPSCIGAACADSAHRYTAGGLRHIVVYWRLPNYLGGCTGTDTTTVLLGGELPNGHLSRYWINGSGARVTADSVCPNTVVIFDDSCTNCTYTSWDIRADGALYTSAGAGASFDTTSAIYGTGSGLGTGVSYASVVSMTVNGCTIKDTESVYVFRPAAGSMFATTPSCTRRDSVKFQVVGATGATAYSWTFGDGGAAASRVNSATHVFTATPPHTYTVVVIDSGGASNHYCTNRDTLVYTTGTPPLNWRISNLYPCRGTVDSFIGPVTVDGTPFNDYYWLFGDGTPQRHTSLSTEGLDAGVITHTFNRIGAFRDTVIVRNSSGCRDTAAVKIVNVFGPTGGLSVSDTSICVGSYVTMRDLNTDIGAVISTPHWWTFNASPMVAGSRLMGSRVAVDGGHGTGTLHSGDTSIAFDVRGLYHIMLNDSDNHGCTNVSFATVHAVKPYAFFTSPDSSHQICIGYNASFTDTNTHCRYSWNYGDGTGWTTPSTTSATATHIYSANGTYTVKCAIFSDGSYGFPAGCTDTFVRVDYIHVGPLVLSSTNLGDDTIASCPPLRLVRSADSAFISYTWRVSPGVGTFTGQFLHTNLLVNGNYTVTMIGTNALGCTDSVSTHYLLGGPAGYISIIPDSGCTPFPLHLHFTDTGIIAASSYYIWNTCPLGSFSTGGTDTTVFINTAGTYCAPTVTVQSGACAITIPYNNPIIVFPQPTMSVTHIGPICSGHDTTLVASGADSHYSWAPSSSELSGFSSDFSSVNLHPLTSTIYTVTGYTTHGCTDTATSNVTVLALPDAGVITGLADVCIGATIRLSDSISGGRWSHTGGYATVSGTGVVTGISSGLDTIKYTVTGRFCSNTLTHVVSVNPPPTVDSIAGLSSVCSGSTILLTSSPAGGSWTVTNRSATVTGGVVTGVTAGLDTIVYTVRNVCGEAIAKKTINTIPSVTPTVHIFNPTDTFCAMDPITLHAVTTNAGSSPFLIWRKFGVPVDTGYLYTLAPNYGDVISLTLYANATCQLIDSAYDVSTLHIMSPVLPVVTVRASRDTIAFAGQIISFAATTTYGGSAPTYQWFVNGVPISGATSNTCYVETYNNDTVYCVVTSNLGCVRNTQDTSNVVVVHTERLSVNGLNNDQHTVSLYPNPNSSSFRLGGYMRAGLTGISYEVTDVAGTVVHAGKLSSNSGIIDDAIELDKNIADGIYILHLHSDVSNEVLHFVVQH